MKIRIGYEIIYDCPQPTPMILTLNVHYTRVSDLIIPDHMITAPSVPLTAYRDNYGNWCSRIIAPTGQLKLSTDALIRDTGQPDIVNFSARQTPVENLPDERGNCSISHQQVGVASRQSVTTSTNIFHLATIMHAAPRRLWKPTKKKPAYAVILPTSPSLSAAV